MIDSNVSKKRPYLIDMAGMEIGVLKVLSKDPEKSSHDAQWLCLCQCGAITSVRGSCLRKNNQDKCRCGTRGKRRSQKNQERPEYGAWQAILYRTQNSHCPAYKDYGGRGIGVDDRYTNFLHFLEDVGHKPGPEYSIGRINNDLGYVPGNIRWETKDQQVNNTRKNTFLEFNGKRQTVKQWADELGISQNLILNRIHRLGWSVKKTLFMPLVKHDLTAEEKLFNAHHHKTKASLTPENVQDLMSDQTIFNYIASKVSQKLKDNLAFLDDECGYTSGGCS